MADILEVCGTGPTQGAVAKALEDIVGIKFATPFIEGRVFDFDAGLGPFASRYADGSVLATFYPVPRGIATHGLVPVKDEGQATYRIAIGSDNKLLGISGEVSVGTMGGYTQRLESALFRLADELHAGLSIRRAFTSGGLRIVFGLKTGYNKSEQPEAVAALRGTSSSLSHYQVR